MGPMGGWGGGGGGGGVPLGGNGEGSVKDRPIYLKKVKKEKGNPGLRSAPLMNKKRGAK